MTVAEFLNKHYRAGERWRHTTAYWMDGFVGGVVASSIHTPTGWQANCPEIVIGRSHHQFSYSIEAGPMNLSAPSVNLIAFAQSMTAGALTSCTFAAAMAPGIKVVGIHALDARSPIGCGRHLRDWWDG